MLHGHFITVSIVGNDAAYWHFEVMKHTTKLFISEMGR